MSDKPPGASPTPEEALLAKIIEILDENRVMCIATSRQDGWPQATLVNYLHDRLRIYFVVGRTSQKFINIQRDPRVSIALGHDRQGGAARGLSMSAYASEVTAVHEIERLNKQIWDRSRPEVFEPHPSSNAVAVMQATPEIVTVVDYAPPHGRVDVARVVEDWRVEFYHPEAGH